MTPEQIGSTYDFWIIMRRWMATWIDILLFFVVLGVAAAAGQRQPVAAVVILLVFGALYYPVLEGLAGFTLGKLLCGLRVVDANGKRPGLLKGILRTVARLVEVNPLLMGALPAGIAVLSSQSRQRLGDMLAKTWVLKIEDLPYLDAPDPTQTAPWGFHGSPQGAPDPAAPGTLPGYGHPGYGDPTQGYPGAGYPAQGYPVQGYPSAGYPAQGYPAQGYPGAGYPGYGYPPAAPPGRRRPLPTSNRLWPLPGALVATVGTVALIGWGIADGKRVEAQRPVTMTIAEFQSAAPQEGYFRITGTQLQVANAVYLQSSPTADDDSSTGTDTGTAAGKQTEEQIRTIYVPVLKAGDKTGKPASLVLETDNERDVKTVRARSKLTDATIKPWLLKHEAETQVKRDVQGTVQGGFWASTEEHDQVAKELGDKVTPNFVVLKEGGTPTAVASIFAIMAGVVSGILSGLFWLVCLINLAATPPRRGATPL